MNGEHRLHLLEAELVRLREAAAGAGVLVEGRKDLRALDALGIGGTHLVVHGGRALERVVDAIAEDAIQQQWPRILILTDWDRTGGRLARRFHDGLAARVPTDLEHRRRLSEVCHSRCIEDVPAELASLRRRFGGRS